MAYSIMGRPATGCSTLGSLDFMRLPAPAARMTARTFINTSMDKKSQDKVSAYFSAFHGTLLLGRMGSNHRQRIQSPMCYHCTTPHCLSDFSTANVIDQITLQN